jgi:hypothetical protein
MILTLEQIQTDNTNPGVLNQRAKFKIQKSWRAKNELKKDLAGQKETFYWAKVLMFMRDKQGKRRKKNQKKTFYWEI